MIIAAVDIGSNAVRFQISRVSIVNGSISYKKIEYIRFPLRLGQDVFTTQTISYKTEHKFMKLMNIFKLMVDLYEVDDYMICATSAMREAINSNEITKRVYYNYGLKIDVIEGEQEAELINKAIYKFIKDGNFIHIDVGGGSTELNVIIDKKKVAGKSFKIGSLRQLSNSDIDYRFQKMSEWIKEALVNVNGTIEAIGTGGNINKILELSERENAEDNILTLSEFKKVFGYIEQFSVEDRITKLKMNKDRADVITSGSGIYMKVMEMAKANTILVPDVGLKDGVMYTLAKKHQMLGNI